MLDLLSLPVLGVLLVGIFGRRRFSDLVKLWLWRGGFLLLFLVAVGQLQEQACRMAQLSPADCRRAPITVGDLIGWLVMAVMLYAVYRIATGKVRGRLKGNATAEGSEKRGYTL